MPEDKEPAHIEASQLWSDIPAELDDFRAEDLARSWLAGPNPAAFQAGKEAVPSAFHARSSKRSSVAPRLLAQSLADSEGVRGAFLDCRRLASEFFSKCCSHQLVVALAAFQKASGQVHGLRFDQTPAAMSER